MKVLKLSLEKELHNPSEPDVHFQEFYAQEAEHPIKIK